MNKLDKFKVFICCILPEANLFYFKDFISELDKEKLIIDNIWENVSWEAPKEYIDEMGDNLITKIITLKEEMLLGDIIKLKKFLTKEENNKADKNSNRKLNLNPRYLSEKGMFLLTHKPNKDRGREQIDNNMWQEKQYDYNDKFIINSNTFSEYKPNDRLISFNEFYDS